MNGPQNGTIFHIIIFIILTIIVYPNLCNNISMKYIANKLNEDLEIMKNEELGINFIKNLYGTFKFTPKIIDANKTVKELARKLETKINLIFSGLSRAKLAIDNMQSLDNITKTRSSLLPCISDKRADLGMKILKLCDDFFDMFIYKATEDHLKVDYDLIAKRLLWLYQNRPLLTNSILVLQKIHSNMNNMNNAIKQQYFLSSWDIETFSFSPFTYCGERDHMLLWKKYISQNNYVRKHIIILLDHGSTLGKNQFFRVKLFAKQMIDTIDPKDKLAVIAIADDWTSPQAMDECSIPNHLKWFSSKNLQFLPANETNKKIFNKFTESLNKGKGKTNHTLGFQQAFKLLELTPLQNEKVMIVYVSGGYISPFAKATPIFEKIAESINNISYPVIINTCAVVEESMPLFHEVLFLQDIAQQNYYRYNVTSPNNSEKGVLVMINSNNIIGYAISNFYKLFNLNKSYDLENKISLPIWDYVSQDLSVSFTTGTYTNNQYGLLGIDLYFHSLIEDVVYYSNNQKHHYAFLIDVEGRVLVHPSFSIPFTLKQQLYFVDISNFEKHTNFDFVRKKILTENSGIYVLNSFDSTIKYTWKRIGEWYVICIVQHEHQLIPLRPYNVNWPITGPDSYNIKLIYHQLEHIENSKLCRHLNQVATLDAGSLYLSYSCFQLTNISKLIQDNIFHQDHMAYLKDTRNLLANPGFKDEIKDEVAALVNILEFLRHQHMSSSKTKYIIRRYVTSYNGVLQMFPGSILEQGLEPTKRPWFLQAVEHRFKLVLTSPYLDEGGAGYIVTLSYATSHVVVAIDVTYGYIYRLVLNYMPFCTNFNITCFLMDDRGYLIYHPNLIDPNGHGPIEKQHIVHKESLIANDILQHENFIRKILCNSYGGGTVQRYYKLNTSFSDVLINLVHCVNYQIVAIPNTNIFIGVVNTTCNIVATFCPCSIVDRLCLNCNRMEQRECECPCECPLELNQQCKQINDNLTNNNPICNWFPEHISLKPQFHRKNNLVEMKSCFPENCSLEKSYFDCLGSTGCEWCKYDVDGSLLNNPFCASLATCFNGIIGSISPYKNLNITNQSNHSLYYISPDMIIIIILALLLLLSIVYICYRGTNSSNNNNNNSNNERLYLSSIQDNNLRMSDLNLSDNNYHDIDNHRDKLLKDDKPNPISPYYVSTNYRRTAPAADSDHGYSTMTQHDESEHLSLAPAEFDSLEDELTSDNTSVHTSHSNKPYNNEISQFTHIPNRNFIVVPVTVHRNMETT